MTSSGSAFARFVNEFVSKNQGTANKASGDKAAVTKDCQEVEQDEDENENKEKKGKVVKKAAQMMQEEERNSRSVDQGVYAAYMQAGHGGLFAPLFLVALFIWQGSQAMSSYW